MKSRVAILAIITTIFSSGCGTGVGNALRWDHDYSSGQADIPTVHIMYAMCTKIISCHSGPSNCVAEVQQVQTIDTEIGLSPNTYINYNAVIAAEFSKEITANIPAADTCISDILNLSCDNPEVQNAYRLGDAEPFAQVADMLPLSCQGVF